MFYFVLRDTCLTLCCGLRVSLCVEGYVFHFMLKVIRVLHNFVLRATCFTLC